MIDVEGGNNILYLPLDKIAESARGIESLKHVELPGFPIRMLKTAIMMMLFQMLMVVIYLICVLLLGFLYYSSR